MAIPLIFHVRIYKCVQWLVIFTVKQAKFLIFSSSFLNKTQSDKNTVLPQNCNKILTNFSKFKESKFHHNLYKILTWTILIVFCEKEHHIKVENYTLNHKVRPRTFSMSLIVIDIAWFERLIVSLFWLKMSLNTAYFIALPLSKAVS